MTASAPSPASASPRSTSLLPSFYSSSSSTSSHATCLRPLRRCLCAPSTPGSSSPALGCRPSTASPLASTNFLCHPHRPLDSSTPISHSSSVQERLSPSRVGSSPRCRLPATEATATPQPMLTRAPLGAPPPPPSLALLTAACTQARRRATSRGIPPSVLAIESTPQIGPRGRWEPPPLPAQRKGAVLAAGVGGPSAGRSWGHSSCTSFGPSCGRSRSAHRHRNPPPHPPN